MQSSDKCIIGKGWERNPAIIQIAMHEMRELPISEESELILNKLTF